jgi:glycosyltransferase involved in cell wall biosynthesis
VLDSARSDTLKVPKFEKISMSLKFGLDRKQVLEAYQISKVAIVTSLHESFCLPLHEALHFNLPVICINKPYAQIESDRLSLFDDTGSLVSKMLMFTAQAGPNCPN